MKRLSFLFLLALLLVASTASARLNVSVTQNPAIYQILDTLTAFGLIDDYMLGQRPLSETEIFRLLNEAKTNLPRVKGQKIEPRAMLLLAQCEHFLPDKKETIADTLRITPLQHFSLQYLFLDSPYRFVTPTVSSAKIDALINPLVAYEGGRPYKDEHNFMFESEHAIHLGSHFDISGQPQFLFAKQNNGAEDTMQWSFDHLYLRSEFKNIGMQDGRDQLVWGFDPEGGNIFSINGRGLDMLKISNITPFHLPWILKYLGKMNATFFFGDLTHGTVFPYTYITGYKLSFLPHKNFEWGFTTALVSGGYGSPQASVGARFVDTIGGYIPNLIGLGNPIDAFASNRIGAFEFALRIPKWRGTQIYWEFSLDDANFNQYKFVYESLNHAGIFIPRLTSDGRNQLRLEYKNAGFLPYRHEQFISGWTNNKLLLGDALGPDAQGVYVRYDFAPTYYWQHQLGFVWEERDSDLYSIPIIHKTVENPAETRFRWWAGCRWRSTEAFEIALRAGYERVQQFNFIPGDDRNNFLTDIKLTWYPEFDS
ncbi:MAG: hypothetical protein HY877_04730 [Deltaproteobacteria bacterium]|nr:hypothetical protein [Deltaproteobacteria bacterium]